MQLIVKKNSELLDITHNSDEYRRCSKTNIEAGTYDIEVIENPFVEGVNDDFVQIVGTKIGAARSFIKSESDSFQLIG